MSEMPKRIAVTGMGLVSPLGNDVQTFWSALCAGKDGLGPITRCNLSDFPVQQGGEVSEIHLPPELLSRLSTHDRSQHMVVAAVKQAVDQAGLSVNVAQASCLCKNHEEAGSAGKMPALHSKVAVVLSTNFASAGTLDGDLGLDTPWTKGNLGFGTASDLVADIWNLSGPRATLSLSCSSGAAAIGYGADLIRSGRADYVIAGGYDAISRFAWAGLSLLRTMTDDKLRPFDKNRSGTLFSEGAGIVVLESYESAKLRNSQILAELCGFGFNNNAYHMTAPSKDGQGIADTMAMALKEAGIGPDMVDHVNTHGTGTQLNDSTETAAIKHVLGKHAYDVPVTSIKSMIGHLMGAAGSVEAIASILTILNGRIPPTINLTTPDPECDLLMPTTGALEADVEVVISNSSGIGGNNVSLVFRRAGEVKP
ncbi:MAG: beta-ketoacyl-[acyl-carrier-protein] synthase family protein [Victivallales bacterium]